MISDAVTIEFGIDLETQPADSYSKNHSGTINVVIDSSLDTTTYQWQRQINDSSSWVDLTPNLDTDITYSGIMTNHLEYSNYDNGDVSGYNYRCVINEDDAALELITESVSIFFGTDIDTQPTDSNSIGGRGIFSISVSSGIATITRQWQRQTSDTSDWVDLTANLDSGITYADFTTNNLSYTNYDDGDVDGYNYRCVVNEGDSDYELASDSVSIEFGIDVTTQSVASYSKNHSGMFNVVVSTGDNAPTPTVYQWQRRTVSNSNYNNISASDLDSGIKYSGYHTDTLSYSDYDDGDVDGYRYRCRINNDNVGYKMFSQSNVINFGTDIDTQPVDSYSNAKEGSFSIVASSGIDTITYQWQRQTSDSGTWTDLTASLDSGITYSDFTTNTLSYSNYDDGDVDGYNYRCVVNKDDTNYELISDTVSLLFGIVITTQPTDQTVGLGSTAHFTIAIDDGDDAPTPDYRWERRGEYDSDYTPITDSLQNFTLVYSNWTTNSLSVRVQGTASTNSDYRCRVNTGNEVYEIVSNSAHLAHT